MVKAGFAAHHEEFWEWVWSIEGGDGYNGAALVAEALIAIFARGGGKSTNAELACVALGARRRRRYALYVSATQDQADKHIGSIGALLESKTLEEHYPALADRAVGKFGSSKGWRRDRLTTRAGFVVDAIGLDTASRGIRFEEQRPDVIVLDDIDELHDTEAIVQKKIETLTDTLLPTGSHDVVVLGVQNLIHEDSIFAQLADGRATFLARRKVIGPIPALRHLRYHQEGARTVIDGGEPTWEGQNLEVCQAQVDRSGIAAFDRESQHIVTRDAEEALWRRAWIDATRVAPEDVPPLKRVVVGVDPSGSKRGDEVGIVAVGIDARKHAYVLSDWSCFKSPDDWATEAVDLWVQERGDRVVAEANYGGEMVESIIRTVARKKALVVPVTLVRASRGKEVRADPVAALYKQGLVHHVGYLPQLENELCRWKPLDKFSPGRLDAVVWGVTHLLIGKSVAGNRSAVGPPRQPAQAPQMRPPERAASTPTPAPSRIAVAPRRPTTERMPEYAGLRHMG